LKDVQQKNESLGSSKLSLAYSIVVVAPKNESSNRQLLMIGYVAFQDATLCKF
jgi:hypothetical protein